MVFLLFKITRIIKIRNTKPNIKIMAIETMSAEELANHEYSILLTHEVAFVLLNIIGYLYILTKVYKVLCYSKLTFEWLQKHFVW